MLYSCSAQISIVSVDPVNSTAVSVTWISTSLNGSVVDHYTVHYSRLNGSDIISSETVTFPASASSGVVSGLQEGQQYQFSVSVSFTVNGLTYNSTPGEPFNSTIYGVFIFSLYLQITMYEIIINVYDLDSVFIELIIMFFNL